MSVTNWVRCLGVFVAALLIFNGCGSSSSGSGSGTTPSPTTTAWTNTAMQTIVQNKCAISGCHAGTQSPNYSGITETAMKADTKALAQVNAGLMPQTGSLTAAEKTTFVNFYK